MPVKIFFCYAHEDESLLNKLKTHLSLLQRQGLIDFWHDRDIKAGEEWEKEIDKHLNMAQIILLLVSPDFLASDYCYSKEMNRALERQRQGEADVIPVILRQCDWRKAPFAHLQCVPHDGDPITKWDNQDDAFYDIAQGIRRILEQRTFSALPKPEVRSKDTHTTPSISQTTDRIYRDHTHHVYTLAWSPDSNYIVSAGKGKLVHVWNASTCQTLYSYSEHVGRLFPYVKRDPCIFAVAWSPNGQLIASGGTGTKMLVWDAFNGNTHVYRHAEKPAHSIRALAWSPDGMRIASICSSELANIQEVVSVWDVNAVQELFKYNMHPSIWNGNLAVTPALAWSPDGRYIASTCGDEIIHVWDATTDRLIASRDRLIDIWHVGAGMIHAIAWSPNNKRLAVANADSTVRVRSMGTSERILILRGHKKYVRTVAWSPDGTRIASGSQDETVRIWNSETGDNIDTRHHHISWVTSVAWSPDGKHIASGSHDGNVHVWRAR